MTLRPWIKANKAHVYYRKYGGQFSFDSFNETASFYPHNLDVINKSAHDLTIQAGFCDEDAVISVDATES